MSTLTELQDWYQEHCDGDWEHQYGVKIDTLDNPGWRLQIDLHGTRLESQLFEEVEVDRSDSDWIRCFLRDGQFHGAGGAMNLEEILRIFLTWARTQRGT